jgi:hypothetical protein
MRKLELKIRNRNNNKGQVLLIGVIVILGLTMIAFSVVNIGIVVAEKIHLQDTVDASAYSSAVVQARYMNLSAYINRAMVANYNSMAFNTALWAVVDADDHGIAVVTALMYQISTLLTLFPPTTAFGIKVDKVADILRDYVHSPFHSFNQKLNELFAQDEGDYNSYIERFNTDILSMYQGLLYAAVQSARHEVAQEVAKKMDPEVITTTVLGLGAEAINYDELASTVDYVVRDTSVRDAPYRELNTAFDKMFGKDASNLNDHPLFLGAVTEASLDNFTAGRTRDGDIDLLRNLDFGNIVPSSSAIEWIIKAICKASCLFLCSCRTEVRLILGAAMREGLENREDEDRVPIITRQRMRQVNFFGVDLKLRGVKFFGVDFTSAIKRLVGEQGHTSGDRWADVANVANTFPDLSRGELIDPARVFQCHLANCNLNYMNMVMAGLMGVIPPVNVDDHWDGTFNVKPVNQFEILYPGPGQINALEYRWEVLANGTEEGVPRYDWRVDLDNVGFAHYHYNSTGAARRPSGISRAGSNLSNNVLVGPSVGVVGVKRAQDVSGLRGLGIGNEYDLKATARAQVYYLRNPNRPDEKPSLFNPHWVARLAPIDSEDTPPFLKDGLTYVGSMGVPLTPTH